MRSVLPKLTFAAMFLLLSLVVLAAPSAQAGELAQQPTGSVPTVTSTPTGPIATVNTDQPQINVRSGPHVNYAEVGVLVAGESVPALGRTAAGTWVQIVYPGVEGGVAWVYANLVTITGGDLPIVEPPPLPTPRVTPTIDPTLASQLILEIPATRLPTYTPPPPLSLLEYESQTALDAGGIPRGLMILFFGVVGLLGALVSFLRGR